MNESFVTVNKTVQMERNSITPEWVLAQRQANLQAGVGLFVCLLVPGTGVWFVSGSGIDTLAVMVAACAGIGVLRFGTLSMVVFTQSEHAADEERAEMELQRNQWFAEYERVEAEKEEISAQLTALTADNKRLREQSSALTFENNRLQQKVGSNKSVAAVPIEVPAERVEINDPVLSDAEKIVSLWFDDVKLVSRDNLLRLGMSRPGIESAWKLLSLLDIAGKSQGAGKERNIIVKDADTVYDLLTAYKERKRVETVQGQMVRPIL